MAYRFYDNFDRANNTTAVGNGWTQAADAGTVNGIQSNRITRTSNASTAGVLYAYRTVTSFTEATFTAKFYPQDLVVGNAMAFTCSAANGYWFTTGWAGYRFNIAGDGSWNIIRRQSATNALLASGTGLSVASGDEFTAKISAGVLKIYLNGTQIASANDSAITTFASVGLYLFTPTGTKTTQADDYYVWPSAEYPPAATFRPRRQRMAALGGF